MHFNIKIIKVRNVCSSFLNDEIKILELNTENLGELKWKTGRSKLDYLRI